MMLPKGKEISARAVIIFDEIQRFAREEFNIPNFSVTRKLTARSDRGWCRGYHIQIGVQSLMTKPVIAFMEYKSFNNYLEVGGFKTDDWRLWFDAVVVHEMAHAVHNAICEREGIWKRARGINFVEGFGRFDSQPHGPTFLNIYKRLRNRFINDRVPREAYTAPRTMFDVPKTETGELKMDPVGKPLEGMAVRIGGKYLIILGKEPNSRRPEFCWKAKASNGTIYNVKLTDLCHTPEVRTIVLSNPALKFLFQGNQQRQAAKAVRRSRGSFGRYTIGY
jgi:hypothetical protein